MNIGRHSVSRLVAGQKRVLFCIVLGALAVLMPSASVAQPAVNEAKVQEAAEQSFFEGLRLYRNKSYPDAIVAFQTAYARTRNIDMLFNIARCYESLGRPRDAAVWYQAYLRGKPVDESAILKRIAVLAPELSSAKNAAAPGDQAALALKPIELQPVGTRWLKWGLIGLSGTALTVSALAGIRAIGDADDLDNARDSVETDQRQKTADRSKLTALSLLGLGLVSGGVATYLILSEAREFAKPSLDVSLTQGGAGVSYSTAF
ncbi:MAG: hypothetical protein VX589_08380 [Myxococcota bacterium]|nr:hypothetical protein [Myxococcota bacterium]